MTDGTPTDMYCQTRFVFIAVAHTAMVLVLLWYGIGDMVLSSYLQRTVDCLFNSLLNVRNENVINLSDCHAHTSHCQDSFRI